MKKLLRASLVTILIAIGWTMTGCGGGIPDATQAAEQQILLFGNGTEPKTLDPQIGTGVTENKIITSLIEGLINYHPTDDNLPEPGVAESWVAEDDHSVWIFNLRKDALWSNGDPVTADDFIYSYRRMLDPTWGGEYAQMLFLIKNAEAYKKGEITDFDEVGVKAVDSNTLRFELKGQTPFFLNMLKHYSWHPVHPPTIEAYGGMLDRSGAWTRPENFVGNGPFKLSSWKPQQYILVEKSDTYWDRDNVKLNGIYFFPVDDHQTERRMFASGQLHITSTVPTNEVPVLREAGDPNLSITPYLGTYFYRLNLDHPPLDDVRVRQALALSVDRKQIVERVTLAGQEPASSYVPPGFLDYLPPENTLSYNPEKARELLAEAGYPNGEGFPEFELLFNTSEGHRKIAEAIVEMWNTNLNINLVLDNTEWKVYLDRQSLQQYDICRAAWIGDYMDPITFLEMWTTDNGNNRTGWSSAEYDALIEKGWRSTGQADHLKTLQDAERILLDELPIVPIYWYTRVTMKDRRVEGMNPKLLDNHPYKYISLNPAKER